LNKEFAMCHAMDGKIVHEETVTWSLVVAVNSEEVLQSNLLGSGEANSAREIFIRRNPLSAAMAYNTGLADCTSDIVVFAHQDVFLPTGWARALSQSICALTASDPNWAVAGVYGVTRSGIGKGHVYSTGLGRFVGESFAEPTQVRSLDEMLLILRRSAGLRFDERLPGFHLYGTDVCLEAAVRGMSSYVVPCFALHNSCGIKVLPMSFWSAYMYLRKKWQSQLPVVTPCTKITVGCGPIMNHMIRACWSSVRGKSTSGLRIADPGRFSVEELFPPGRVLR
jgi:hypothetical protein